MAAVTPSPGACCAQRIFSKVAFARASPWAVRQILSRLPLAWAVAPSLRSTARRRATLREDGGAPWRRIPLVPRCPCLPVCRDGPPFGERNGAAVVTGAFPFAVGLPNTSEAAADEDGSVGVTQPAAYGWRRMDPCGKASNNDCVDCRSLSWVATGTEGEALGLLRAVGCAFRTVCLCSKWTHGQKPGASEPAATAPGRQKVFSRHW